MLLIVLLKIVAHVFYESIVLVDSRRQQTDTILGFCMSCPRHDM